MSLPWLVSLRLSRFDDDAGYPVVAFPCLDGGLHCEGGAIVAPANFLFGRLGSRIRGTTTACSPHMS